MFFILKLMFFRDAILGYYGPIVGVFRFFGAETNWSDSTEPQKPNKTNHRSQMKNTAYQLHEGFADSFFEM